MPDDRVQLPQGYRLASYAIIDSTNTEALRLADAGVGGNIWVWAQEQTAGRGRLDRSWQSLEGNLFASLLLYPECEPAAVSQLGFVMGNAMHDAVTDLLPPSCETKPCLKWPNDLLLGRGKAAGMLLETRGQAVAIGVGLNIADSPDGTGQSATSLSENGISTKPDAALGAIANSFEKWRSVWNNGAGFDDIRISWLERSLPAGSHLSVHVGTQKMSGTFAGLDRTGALLLNTKDGEQKCITAGDVFQL